MRSRASRSVLVALILVVWVQAGYAQAQLEASLSRLPAVLGKPVTYQRNGTESLYSIARRYGIGAVMINNANAGSLREGNELLALPTAHIAPLAQATGLVVNLPERKVFVYRDGRPFKVFPLAIGMRGWETPTGDFRIANKRKNPTWFPPKWAIEEKPVPPGPKNPLGDRWMGLSIPGYGLHATNAPASIGRFASHGCMRLYPEHAHALYDLVRVGTPVKIVYQTYALGYSPEDGLVYFAHHPDPYQVGDVTVEEVRAELAAQGLAEVADLEAVATGLEHPRGLLLPVVGSDTKVKVGNRPIRFALHPVPVDGDWLVPVGPLAQALQAQVEVGAGAAWAILSRPGYRLMLSRNSQDALLNGALVAVATPMRTAAGYPLVPLKATATALGSSVGWDEETRTVLVWNVPTPAPAAPGQVGAAGR